MPAARGKNQSRIEAAWNEYLAYDADQLPDPLGHYIERTARPAAAAAADAPPVPPPAAHAAAAALPAPRASQLQDPRALAAAAAERRLAATAAAPLPAVAPYVPPVLPLAAHPAAASPVPAAAAAPSPRRPAAAVPRPAPPPVASPYSAPPPAAPVAKAGHTYSPKPGSAPFAVLVALHAATLHQPPLHSLSVEELKSRASQFTESDLYDSVGKWPPWEGAINTLVVHYDLVSREADRFSLQPQARTLAAQCHAFHHLLADWQRANSLTLTFPARQMPRIVRPPAPPQC